MFEHFKHMHNFIFPVTIENYLADNSHDNLFGCSFVNALFNEMHEKHVSSVPKKLKLTHAVASTQNIKIWRSF